MKIKDYLIPMLLALVLLAVGAWLAANTEWADIEVPTPAKGQALNDRFYAAERLLRELGGTVVRRTTLDELPPPHGRLILDATAWDLFPGRQQRLKTWVEQGGHLVIPGRLLGDESLKDWLPVAVQGSQDDDDEDDSGHEKSSKTSDKSSSTAPGKPEPPIQIKGVDCRKVVEPATVPARYPGHRDYVACVDLFWGALTAVKGRGQPLWQVDGTDGTGLMRMPFGRGSVTVIGNMALLNNPRVLLGDDPLLVAAALQAQRGAAFWFVTEESREPLLVWLWRRGGVAVCLALLAFVWWLWRSAVRFGPLTQPASANRRSMAEQVRGTGRFLLAHGDAALHAAQLRALHEAAAPRLKGYAQLDTDGRAAAIASATGLDHAALLRAMQAVPRRPHVLTADLELIEIARRRLLSGSGSASQSHPDQSPPSS